MKKLHKNDFDLLFMLIYIVIIILRIPYIDGVTASRFECYYLGALILILYNILENVFYKKNNEKKLNKTAKTINVILIAVECFALIGGVVFHIIFYLRNEWLIGCISGGFYIVFMALDLYRKKKTNLKKEKRK